MVSAASEIGSRRARGRRVWDSILRLNSSKDNAVLEVRKEKERSLLCLKIYTYQ